jgi:predicted GTPase
MRKVIIMGAGGRDFHDFNVVYRGDPSVEVVALTAAQIPGIDHRRYPASLAGPLYPDGIPIRPEAELADLIARERADEVVLAYSDLSHLDVMHKASTALAAGADFSLLGPRSTMLASEKPVVAVCAVRTGSGKSQTSRRVGQILLEAGLKVALVRHPMPYGDLEAMRVQRFASLQDIDASNPTIEEREEYEAPVEMGMVMYAGVDYAAILAEAQDEADVIVWDGGNNDFPFFRPDLLIVVVDPLRAGHELKYHPGETNLRMADVVLVNKLDSAGADSIERVFDDIGAINPGATVIRAASPVTLDDGPGLLGKAVLIVEDGSTVTHGGMPFGAGTVACQAAGAWLRVDPRPYAWARSPRPCTRTRTSGASCRRWATRTSSCGSWRRRSTRPSATWSSLARRSIRSRHPIRHVRYELRELGQPTLADVLAPVVAEVRERAAPSAPSPRISLEAP